MDAVRANAFSTLIDRFECINPMTMMAEGRRDAILCETDRPRERFAQRLRRVINDIEEAEFKVIAADEAPGAAGNGRSRVRDQGVRDTLQHLLAATGPDIVLAIMDHKLLARLVPLNRYEQCALARRRFAIQAFDRNGRIERRRAKNNVDFLGNKPNG